MIAKAFFMETVKDYYYKLMIFHNPQVQIKIQLYETV